MARLTLAIIETTQPTISLPEKNWAISIAAVSAASDPWTEFSPTLKAHSLRIVPGAALAGFVGGVSKDPADSQEKWKHPGIIPV